VGAESADTTAFGLITDPAADRDQFRFVHASDAHVHNEASALEFREALDEIAALSDPADFVIITGDLVNTGRDGEFGQLAHAASVLADPPITVFPAFGDHDADSDSLLVRSFESVIGPTHYSFDRGPYHFIIHNDVYSASLDGTFPQLTWLANDIAAVPDSVFIYVFTHFQPDRQEFDLYQGLGVDGVFSGHWHANRALVMEGIVSVNSGTLRMAGIDRSSRGFRLIDLDAGEVRASYRTGGIAPRLSIVSPPQGMIPFGGVEIRAMGYATSNPGLSARFTVSGASGPVATGDLASQGGWAYSGTWDAVGLQLGNYQVDVELLDENLAVVATASREVTLEHIVAPVGTPGTAWARFRGNLQGSGIVDADLTTPLYPLWVRHIGGPTELASPVIADGRAYIAHGIDGALGSAALVALDLATGDELWRHLTGAEVKGAPAVADGRVIVITSDATVQAVDAMTGGLIWSTPLGDQATRYDVTSPMVADGVVYVGGPAVTAALDAATGSLIWEQNLGVDWLATVYSAAVCDETRVVLGLYSGLWVLDRASGSVLWSRAANNRETHRSPALVDGVLYAAGDNFGSQNLRALDVQSGAELWTAQYNVGNSNSAPAVTDSLVIIGSGLGRIEAFARSDGRSLWQFAVGSAISSGLPYNRDQSTVTSSPLVAQQTAYVGADDGRLYALNADSGALYWSVDLGAPVRSSPAASGTYLLVATVDGTLFAFVSGELAAAGAGGDPAGAPPLRSSIGAAWPNPFRAAGTIPFVVAGSGVNARDAVPTRLVVYDIAGRPVRTLIQAPLAVGRHQADWDGRDEQGRRVASGVYFLRLKTEAAVATGRLSLLR
jgi:outer membrane protein assembly factor BamB/predicted phosphodiesterase